MHYINLDIKYLKKDIYELWNETYGNIYPITEELFKRNSSNLCYNSSFIALDENEKIVGFILTKIWNNSFLINGYSDSGWINLFCVSSQYRNLGIGSKLLELAEKEMRKMKKNRLYLGRDLLNYFPGLPIDLKNNAEWFEKRGFNQLGNTCDLIKIIKDKNCEKLLLRNNTYTFRLATLADKDGLLELMTKNWPGRWKEEMTEYFNNGGTGREYAIALDGNKICAFAKIGFPQTPEPLESYSLTWRNRFKSLGGIGPLGVDADYRKRNLGYDIVAFANNVLIDNNATEIIIDWTSLLDFYRKMGFEVFKSYLYMTKEF